MLGQPVSMLIPQVVGFRLTGELPEGSTATDLVLTVTQMLRERGVVGKFVEFCGPGPAEPAARRPRDHREHVARDGRHVRDLPGRRRDAPLPRVLRPPEGARGAGGGLLPRAGPVPRRGLRGGHLLRHARARPGDVVPSLAGPQAPAGPRGARRTRPRTSAPSSTSTGRADVARRATTRRSAESFPASDPPTEQRRRRVAEGRATATRQPGTAVRRARGGLRPRRGGDRRDHELHEHLEPVGDARRRACSPRRRSRPGSSASRG